MKAIVTGGCNGLGKCFTKYLLNLGYTVYATYYSSQESAQELLSHNDNLEVIKVDLHNEEEVINLFKKIDDIDLIINNAGISKDNYYEDKTIDEFMEVIRVNLGGTYLMMKNGIKKLQPNGMIINISSNNALTSYNPISMDYDASKAGINILTKDFKIILDELNKNQKIASICPGWINTESVKNADPKYIASEMRRVKQEKLLDPNDLAKYIIDNKDYFLNGEIKEIISLDGKIWYHIHKKREVLLIEKYVKIYSHKKIKVGDDVLDVLHLEDLAYAIEKNNLFQIVSGKYQGKYVNKLSSDFEKHDFVCDPITLVEKKLMTSGQCNEEEINLENYLKKSKYEYFIVFKTDENSIYSGFCVRETNDENIIKTFNMALNPTVQKELENLIDDCMNGKSNGFILDDNLFSKMLGQENSLTLQDENNYKGITEYNISEKYESLKKKIIGLDNELKVLLSNITKNISLSYSKLSSAKIKELKSNILIIGSRGTGKTLMIESIADLFKVPSTIEDATRYTPTAYQGENIEDILINLYYKSGEDKSVFEHGIVFIDEFDKICKKIGTKEDAIKEMTQNSLLTILRGTTIVKKIRNGLSEKKVELDTSKITFVLSGAFEEIIDKENITKEDLISYGVIPQLADRIVLTIKTKNPSKEDLRNALVHGEYSYLNLLGEYLNAYGVSLEIDEDFINYIVDEAFNLKSGYRGLSEVITKYLNNILFDIYDGKIGTIKLSRKRETDE